MAAHSMFLPGESQGQWSLVGCRLWGHRVGYDWSYLAAAAAAAEGEEKDEGPEKIFEEIIAENFPHMGKEISNQVQEAQRILSWIKPRRNALRHIVIKVTEIRDRGKILKARRKNENKIQGNSY